MDLHFLVEFTVNAWNYLRKKYFLEHFAYFLEHLLTWTGQEHFRNTNAHNCTLGENIAWHELLDTVVKHTWNSTQLYLTLVEHVFNCPDKLYMTLILWITGDVLQMLWT